MKENGYFTIEITLLMPIVLGIILLVIELWFFQYDRCLMDLDIGKAGIEATILRLDSNNRVALFTKRVNALEKKKYLGWKSKTVKGQIEHNNFSIQYSGYLKFPFRGLMFWKGSTTWATNKERKNHILDQSYSLRLARKMNIFRL